MNTPTASGPASASAAAAAQVVVIGIGADGWNGLGDEPQRRLHQAEVVLGGDRHLAMLPPVAGQTRLSWPSPLRAGLPALLARCAGRRMVVLASGDPLVSGIGTTLIELLGAQAVDIHPAVSSVALARARMGWSAESVDVVSVVGRDAHRVLRHLAPEHRLLVLSSGESTPAHVAELLVAVGYGQSVLTVLGNLGSDETRTSSTAAQWTAADGIPRLHVLAIELAGPLTSGWCGGLPDDAFEHDGQLTKRDLRASALARLMPAPGQLLWDVGAGAGSVGIEWLRACPTGHTIAIEANARRAERITGNAQRLGVPMLEVLNARAPEALEDLAAPDAIFVGGGAGRPGLIDICMQKLRPGGRLVMHAVTLETDAKLAAWHKEYGGELTRIAVEHAAPIGTYTGWTPARSVTQWAYQSPTVRDLSEE